MLTIRLAQVSPFPTIHWSGGPPGLLPFAAFAAILLVLNIGFRHLQPALAFP
jgi:hypothetical protein